MIVLTIQDTLTGRGGVAHIPSEFGPMLRSYVNRERNALGELASGSFQYDKEDALVRAMAAYGQFAAALNQTITEEDPSLE